MKIAAATFALALLVLVPAALAQQINPAVAVTAKTTPPAFALGQEQATVWTVRNNGPTDATVTVSRTLPPGGWTGDLAAGDSSFTLAGNSERDVTLRVKAPATGASGSVTLSLAAQVQDAAGRTASDSETMTLALSVPAPTPDPVLPPPDRTLAFVASGFGGVLVVGAAAYWFQARRIGLSIPTPPVPVTAGTDGVCIVRVQNFAHRKQDVQVRVGDLPAGWYGAFSFPTLFVAPRGTIDVPLSIKVPAEAPVGSVRVEMAARPNSYSPWLVEAHVAFEVVHLRKPGPAT